ncbi:MAG TPA: hypothetical protein VMW19_16630 [Myxococcota bacterium]|nr:hypothetical protein [Myxococcota bacterium]
MKLRTCLAGAATLLFAVQGMAVIKTYTADADNSTLFPSDRRVYRGDCDPGASTPNHGDNQPLAGDQCACSPGVNCSFSHVPAPKLCVGGSRANLDCNTNTDCPSSTCALAIGDDACGGSEGRPHGGACDPGIAYPAAGSCPPTFLTHGSPQPPCNLTSGGHITINDTGNGTPTLTSMLLIAEWDDFVGAATVTGIPGATAALHAENTITVTPNQTGTGSTSGTINWGTIVGWSQTGRLFCQTGCPSPGCGTASACKPFVGFEGLGPPAPIEPPQQFNLDPWVFTGDKFTSKGFEIVSLGSGAVTANTQIGGRLVAIPALPLAALGGLGAGLVYLGSRALGRKKD